MVFTDVFLCSACLALAAVIPAAQEPRPAVSPPAVLRVPSREAELALGRLRRAMLQTSVAGDLTAQRAAAVAAVELLVREVGSDHWRTELAREELATVDRILAFPEVDRREWTATCAALKAAQRLRLARDFEPAFASLRDALATRERLVGPDHLAVDEVLKAQCLALSEASQLQELPALMARRAQILGMQHPPGHPVLLALQRDAAVYAHALSGDSLALADTTEHCLAQEIKWHGERGTDIGTACANLGVFCASRGYDERAEAHFRRAIACFDAVGSNSLVRLDCMSDLASLWLAQGRIEEAQAMAEAAVALSREHYGLALPSAVLKLVSAHVEAGRLDTAGGLLEDMRAEIVGGGSFDPETQRDILNALFIMARRRGDVAAAAGHAAECLALARRVFGGEHPMLGIDARNLGFALVESGDADRGLQHLREGLRILLAHYGEGQVDTLETRLALALALELAGSRDAAQDEWQRAVRSWELARLRTACEGSARTWLERLPVHRSLAVALAGGGQAKAAWHALEAGSGRPLLDDLSWRSRVALSEGEADQQRVLLERARAASDAAARATDDPRAEADPSARSGELQRAADEAWLALQRWRAELAVQHGPAAGEVFDLARIQRQIEPDSALVAWVSACSWAVAPADEHQSTPGWACIVRRDGPPRWLPIAPSSEAGWTHADYRALRTLSQAIAAGGDPAALERAREILIEPLLPELEGVRQIIVVAADPLGTLPLETLLHDRTISYAPSATVYAWLRERAPAGADRARHLLAVGDPHLRDANPLPNSRRECTAIARAFTATTFLLGDDATGPKVNAALGGPAAARYSHLHFATHGYLAPGSAQLPYLLLGAAADDPADTRVGAAQVLHEWRLDAEVVTFSACHTAATSMGHVDFAQALLTAGAHAVVLSLWEVDDVATTLLMLRFYENLTGHGGAEPSLPAAAALAEARRWLAALTWEERARLVDHLELVDADALERDWKKKVAPSAAPQSNRAERPFAHPRFWAAFVLIGGSR